MQHRFLGITFLLIISLAMTACDNSIEGFSSDSNSRGAVAAAPLKNANVYGYTADNTAILIGKTNADGAIKFTPQLSDIQFPSVVYSEGGQNYQSDAPFGGTLKGIIKTASSQTYLTPATTIIAELYTKGMPLKQAEQTVFSLITNEMGLTEVNPLSDPLTDVNQSEIIAQALMFTLGITEENAESLEPKLLKTAHEIIAGKTFSEALKTIESSPLKDTDISLATLIKNNREMIVNAAAQALGDKADQTELKKNAAANTTTERATVISLNNLPLEAIRTKNGLPHSYSFTPCIYSNFVDVNGMPKQHSTDTMQLVVAPSFGSISRDGCQVTVGQDIPNGSRLTISVMHSDIPALPATTSFTMMSNENPNLTKSFTVTFIAPDALAIKSIACAGNNLYEFKPTPTGTIASGATRLLEDSDFTIKLNTVNNMDFEKVNTAVETRFTAPVGFTFQFEQDGKTIKSRRYDVTEIAADTNGSRDTFFASIFEKHDVKLVADKETAPGFKTLGIRAINKSNGTVTTATHPLIFVPYGAKDNITEIILSGSSINDTTGKVLAVRNTDVNSTTNIFSSEATGKYHKLVFNGTFTTWNSIAHAIEKTGQVDTTIIAPTEEIIKAYGQFYIVSDSGKSVFATDASGKEVKKTLAIDKTKIKITKYAITVDVNESLHYKYDPANGPVQDTLRLMYVPFDSALGPVVTSTGGLILDIDTSK